MRALFGLKVNKPPPPSQTHTRTIAHAGFFPTESVITLIQWLFFFFFLSLLRLFYLSQAVCLCIVTGGAKHTAVLLPYSVGVRHQNIFIIKMLTICGLCSARIYSRFKSPPSSRRAKQRVLLVLYSNGMASQGSARGPTFWDQLCGHGLFLKEPHLIKTLPVSQGPFVWSAEALATAIY